MNIQKTSKMVGTTMYSSAEFKNFNNVKIIPNTVTFTYKQPTSPAISSVISPVAGEYSSVVFLNVAGDWVFRWECDGEFASADEFEIFVCESNIG